MSRAEVARRLFAADMRWHLATRDMVARDNADRRAACRANADLCSSLAAEASRMGRTWIDWPEYFRNADISCP